MFQHEQSIDVGKIDCSRPINELSEETRRDLERIQWDEDQKMKGTIYSRDCVPVIGYTSVPNIVPISFAGNLTSTELSQHELLRKSWNVEGSPFKGMPFDPSVVQFAKTD